MQARSTHTGPFRPAAPEARGAAFRGGAIASVAPGTAPGAQGAGSAAA